MTDLSNIKALTWDVGGTVFDWRGAIQREVRRLANERNADVDVTQFATDWRRWMFERLALVRSGELPWMNADQIHRQVLDDVLDKHSALALSKSERDDLNEVWHRLDAWPDAADAIRRIRERYTTVVLTVLSYSIAVDCSRRNGIDWDGILSCEFLGSYKTDPEAYLRALELLRAEPDRAMMVAAHAGDLRAAKAAGLHTAYVHRKGESDVFPGSSNPESAASEFDVVAVDFPDLADKLLA